MDKELSTLFEELLQEIAELDSLDFLELPIDLN